jgi:hypothetical protein
MNQSTKICKKCKNERRETQFSFDPRIHGKRLDVCRSCNITGLAYSERHKILREVYRHYLDLKDYVSRTGQDVIEYSVETEPGSGEYVKIDISFSDLREGVSELAIRKREAFFYNVILDWKQKDVAARMGITTVSVGQYVDAACLQLSKRYFAESDAQQSVQNQEGNEYNGTVARVSKSATG